ncbi:MAG: exodeoxyribonuclease V subunit gamma, partial [Verrucomicrobia bacterium]|nr:exodeoxyribonuclease V subunit gamma [Verrucomicrobiota bacterium]
MTAKSGIPIRELYTSHRLEALTDKLAEVLARPLAAPLQPEVIIVQSQGMARWLKLQLAERHGICANYSFQFPKIFCAQTLAAYAPACADEAAFEREVMAWSILKLLPEMLTRPEFDSLKNYLADPDDVRKRFQLAAQIANLFDQYLVFRPDLMPAWEQRRSLFADGPQTRHEAWQAALWRRLRQENPGQHFAGQWQSLGQRLEQPGGRPAGVPARVSVFGISALPPMYLQFLYALGGSSEVRLFLLQPSNEYWGSIVNARESEKILKAAKRGDAAADELHLDAGNQLLSSMGNLGRDFLNLVQDTGDWDEHGLFPETVAENLLQNVQADICRLRDRGREGGDRLAIAAGDDSLRVHSCHSPLREVEVLHDHLLDWFERDPSLKPRDVLVMMPDVEAYAPFIQAVFDSPEEENRRIPFSLADRGARQASQIIDVFLNLLGLAATRLEAASLMRILEAGAVREKFSLAEADLDVIRGWICKTNIRWGRDAAHRERLGLPGFAENTWQQGLERLFLGYAMAGRGEKMFQTILPFDDLEGGNAAVLGRFAEFLNRVFGLIAGLEQRRSAGQWAEFLAKTLDDFFEVQEKQMSEAQRLRAALHELSRQAAEAGYEEAVDLAVVLESLQQRLEENHFESGFITGGVTFCALKPMRSIPFKIICLLGMNDGDFPRSDRRLSFDLMAQQPRLGDRSLRLDDRYLFLETLLSARQRLHVSYVGQSIRDNSEAPPSVLVSELLDYIAQACEVTGKDIVKDVVAVRHRLQAFSPTYFKPDDSRLFSYSAENCRASSCGQQPRLAPGPFVDQPLGEPEAEWRTVDAAALAAFFCHPAKWLLTRRLGLRFAEADDVLEEVESFAVGSLDGYAMRQQLVEMSLKGTSFADALELMKASGRLPLGEAGAICFRQLKAEVQAFLEQLRPHLGDGFAHPLRVDHQASEFRVRGEINRLTAAGLLHFRCAGIKAKDRLRLWIEQVLLAAALPAGGQSPAVLVGRDEVLVFPPVKDAPAILTNLLGLYWQGLRQPLK